MKWPFTPFVGADGLLSLKNYKYVSPQCGWVEDVLMPPFWNWLTNQLPMWLAPNMITSIGVVGNFILSSWFLWYGGVQMNQPVPNFMYFVMAFSVFAYQTLDGMDGKQARRTGSSSPLGQLFDHGADAVASSITALTFVTTARLGGEKYTSALVVLWAINIPFFLTNWEEAQTGRMRFGTVGVGEAQFLMTALYLFLGVVGPDVLQQKVPFPAAVVAQLPFLESWIWTDVVVRGSLVACAKQSFDCVTSTVASVRATGKGGTACVARLLSFGFFLATTLAWLAAPTKFWAEYTLVVVSILCSLFCYQVCRLIVSNVAGKPDLRTFKVLLFYPLVALNAHSVRWTKSGQPVLPELQFALFFLGLVTFVYFYYWTHVINEITAYLGIRAFTIPYGAEKEARDRAKAAAAAAAADGNSRAASPKSPRAKSPKAAPKAPARASKSPARSPKSVTKRTLRKRD